MFNRYKCCGLIIDLSSLKIGRDDYITSRIKDNIFTVEEDFMKVLWNDEIARNAKALIFNRLRNLFQFYCTNLNCKQYT